MSQRSDDTIMELILARFDGVDRGIEEVKATINNHIEDSKSVEERVDDIEQDMAVTKRVGLALSGIGTSVLAYMGWAK